MSKDFFGEHEQAVRFRRKTGSKGQTFNVVTGGDYDRDMRIGCIVYHPVLLLHSCYSG